MAWLTSAFVRLLGQNVALADSKLTHGWAGGQLIFPEVIMSKPLDGQYNVAISTFGTLPVGHALRMLTLPVDESGAV